MTAPQPATPGSPPIAPCPTCGAPTVGRLIVGRIYDHGCHACADQIDADFDSFIDRLVSGDLDDEIDAAAYRTNPSSEETDRG